MSVKLATPGISKQFFPLLKLKNLEILDVSGEIVVPILVMHETICTSKVLGSEPVNVKLLETSVSS